MALSEQSLRLKTQIQRLNTWLKQDALPFWSTQGINPDTKAVYEQLLFDGTPDLNANQRIRVQARQIMVFSASQHLGWLTHDQSLTDGIHAFMAKFGQTADMNAGYVPCLSPSRQILEHKLDLYDYAFYLLACFHRFNAFKQKPALAEAEALLQQLETQFKNESAGWLEGNYTTNIRRQNPHMHLFEAFMTGFECTQDAKWLAKAGQIYSLFEQIFFAADKQILYEFFTPDWQLAKSPLGDTIEPGHMLEWVWLLRWYEKLTQTPVAHYCAGLYQKALEIGSDPESQLIYDAVDEHGKIISGTKRCWPITELIKASLVQASAIAEGSELHQHYEEKATLGIQLLFDYYMHPDIAGSYIDQIDEFNQVKANHAPASTLYHFLVAGLEANTYEQKFL